MGNNQSASNIAIMATTEVLQKEVSVQIVCGNVIIKCQQGLIDRVWLRDNVK